MNSGVVLVVDDDDRQARTIMEYLQLQGIEAETASNGFAAINAAKRLHPALVLLDIRMPGLDGIEVTKHLQQARPTPKVILMSGFANSVQDANMAKLGVFAVVQRPIPLKVLASFVRRAISESGE